MTRERKPQELTDLHRKQAKLICEVVFDHYEIGPGSLMMGPNLIHSPWARARQMAIWMIYYELGLSRSNVGKLFDTGTGSVQAALVWVNNNSGRVLTYTERQVILHKVKSGLRNMRRNATPSCD